LTDDDWRAIIETNFLSGVRLSRHYLPHMKQAGWGRIIFISSESAVNIPTEMIHYGVTKTMQVALARGLAETTAGTGVTVNSILAGPTNSEGVAGFLKEMAKAEGITMDAVEKKFFQTARPSSLLQRFATTNEVAAMTVFVASPLSAATNGAALRVEGGLLRTIL
jgi:NAD(P)-dependent dehydrogenase (short-subunit alcohol dehydrogenase family)